MNFFVWTISRLRLYRLALVQIWLTARCYIWYRHISLPHSTTIIHHAVNGKWSSTGNGKPRLAGKTISKLMMCQEHNLESKLLQTPRDFQALLPNQKTASLEVLGLGQLQCWKEIIAGKGWKKKTWQGMFLQDFGLRWWKPQERSCVLEVHVASGSVTLMAREYLECLWHPHCFEHPCSTGFYT